MFVLRSILEWSSKQPFLFFEHGYTDQKVIFNFLDIETWGFLHGLIPKKRSENSRNLQ